MPAARARGGRQGRTGVAGSAGYGLDALRRDLTKKGPSPVYVVEGEETVLAAEAVGAILDAALPRSGRDFNLGTFSGDDETGKQFLAQARSFPFLGERRVVIVRRFEKLALRDRDETAFLDYLQDPTPTTVLVLVAASLDRRTTVAKALDRRARIVKVASPKDPELAGWVRQRLAARGVQAGEAATARLVELAGPSLLDLGNEIEKVLARYPETKRIDVAQVDATVGLHRAEEAYAINRAFAPDDPAGFLRVLARLLETEDELLRLVALLQRQVNDLLRVRVLLDRGMREGDVVARLHMNPYRVGQLLPQARAFTRQQLVLWARNLQRAEVQMKSLRLPPRWTFERALVTSFLGRELA
jgi:DNA polymerase-3 subunit delta